MMDWDLHGIWYTGLESACGFSVEHACVLTTDGGIFDDSQTIHNHFAARSTV